jgi:hypothetical protein
VPHQSGNGARGVRGERGSGLTPVTRKRCVMLNGDGSSEAGNWVRYGASRIPSTIRLPYGSSTGATSLRHDASTSASEMATCACGMPVRTAAIAAAYSQGSRRTKSGRQRRHVSLTAGSMAAVLRRPNTSLSMRTAASFGEAAGTRSRIAASSSEGGSALMRYGRPARSTNAASAGGTMTSTSSPRRSSASMNGISGLK